MFKAKKRMLMYLAACLILSVMLSGCAAKKDTEVETSAPATIAASTAAEAAPSTKPELEQVELSWYVPGTAQKDTELVETEINNYLKDKINATVKIKFIDWSSFEQKLNAMTATGENYDLAFTASWFNNYVTNAGKGAFLAMDDLFDQYGKNLKDKFGKYMPAAAIGGKIYAVPYNVGAMAIQRGINVSKELVDKYKFDPTGIKQLADLEPL